MAWPPPLPPNTFVNLDPQQDAHPDAHNRTADALAEIVGYVDGNVVRKFADKAAATTGWPGAVDGNLFTDPAGNLFISMFGDWHLIVRESSVLGQSMQFGPFGMPTVLGESTQTMELMPSSATATNPATAQRVRVRGSIRFDQRVAATGLVSTGGTPLVITAAGEIAEQSSSARYKVDVEDIDDTAIDRLLDLRPVWYRPDPATTHDDPARSYYGLIAEEVAQVDPRLVTYKVADDCACGDVEHWFEHACLIPESVNYGLLAAHLLALVQRQHADLAALGDRVAALEV